MERTVKNTTKIVCFAVVSARGRVFGWKKRCVFTVKKILFERPVRIAAATVLFVSPTTGCSRPNLENLLGKSGRFAGVAFCAVFGDWRFSSCLAKANRRRFGHFGPFGGRGGNGWKTRGEVVGLGPPLRPGGRFWVAFFRSVLRNFCHLAAFRVLTPLFRPKSVQKT